MPAPGTPLARVVRAAMVSLWATLLALGAHVAGSGEAPPLVALVPVVLGSTALTWLATVRRIGFGSALLLLAVPQVGVHALSAYVHGHSVLPSSVEMVAAHVVGLAVMAGGIALAERLWWAWWRRVAVVLRPRVLPVPVVRAPRPAPRVELSLAHLLLHHVVVRRGPPFSRVVDVPVTRACG